MGIAGSRIQDAAPGGLGLLTLFDYDPNGNETLLTDPKGQTVTSSYDPLNRMDGRTYAFAAGETEIPWRRTTGVAYEYDKNESEVTGVVCEGDPVCALVIAVYESERWSS